MFRDKPRKVLAPAARGLVYGLQAVVPNQPSHAGLSFVHRLETLVANQATTSWGQGGESEGGGRAQLPRTVQREVGVAGMVVPQVVAAWGQTNIRCLKIKILEHKHNFLFYWCVYKKLLG